MDCRVSELSDWQLLLDQNGCLYDLLVYGLCLLDQCGHDDVLLEHGLDLLDHGLLDHFIHDGLVDDLGFEGGIDLDGGELDVLWDGCGLLYDDLADLGGELSGLDDGGGDLGLVESLGDLADLELLSLAVDDGLDLLLLDGVDVFAVRK